MKLIRNAIFSLLLCLLCLLLLRAAQPLRDPGRLWIGGRELTGGGEVEAGGGTAVYDAATGTLTLTNAVISGDFRGAAIYAEGDLTVLLVGDSRVEGTKSGCTVLGDLTVSGQGTLTLSGGSATDFRPVFEHVDRLLASGSFANLRGLLYFTDGMGIYPAKRPDYETAFVLLEEPPLSVKIPPWAIRILPSLPWRKPHDSFDEFWQEEILPELPEL